ncbi:MAG TPA: hypothetical protein VMY42_15545 [Thermoguttaceae bacterium]|nr:hypothetical protein [Thermoguttaceae bacterium]
MSLSNGVRDCKACSACCNYLRIPPGEVGPGIKPAGVLCPRRSADGCRIYSRRPRLCADFQCAWLSDPSWPMAWRPDQSGLLCLKEEIETGMSAAAVYEIRGDALQKPVAAEILEDLQETVALIVIVDMQQRRHRLWGKWSVEPAKKDVPAPHFLGQQHAEPGVVVRDSARG